MDNNNKKKIQKYKSEFFQEKYQSLTIQDGSLWKATKNLLKTKEQIPPLNDPNGVLAVSDIDKANLLGTISQKYSLLTLI